MSRRGFLGGAAGLGAAALLTACGRQEQASDSAANGRPKRIVALSTGHLDHCLALGIMPVGMAVAASEATDTKGVPAFIKDAFGARFDLDKIAIVGQRQTPDIEKIAGLKPDMILSNQRGSKSLNEQLTRIAPTVLTKGGSDAFKSDMNVVADALGRSREGQGLLADYEQRARAWAAARGNSETISLVRGKGDQYLYFGTLALASIVGTDAGLKRPPSQQFSDKASRTLSLEQAGLLDADWLFYSFPGTSGDFTQSPLWKKLPAVAAGRAIEVDVDSWFVNASTVAAERVLADMQKFMGRT
ncbi:iron-siderophore ABC transporter substrate-binding protein [Tsukamurella serpentis]